MSRERPVEQPVALGVVAMNASSTLPFDVQCSGVRLPTQFTLTIERVPVTWST